MRATLPLVRRRSSYGMGARISRCVGGCGTFGVRSTAAVARRQGLKLAKSSPARHAHTRAHATHAHALPNLATSGTAWARGVKQWRKHATYKEYACITVDITDSDSRSTCTVRRSMAQVILIVVLLLSTNVGSDALCRCLVRALCICMGCRALP